MADFRTKVITLSGAALMFAGLAFGQDTVASNGLAASAVFVRAEGTTELVAPSTVTVQQTGAAASVNLTVYLSPSVAITSLVVNKVSETTACPSGGGACASGTVSGSSVAFTGITVPAGVAQTVITISNIRVNASTIATSSGVPTGVSETVFVGGTGITPIVPTPVTVAYALNGLGAIASANATANTVCGGASVGAVNFNVTVADGFAGSFKTQTDETGVAMVGSPAPPGTPLNEATSGTRVAVTFNNVPTNVSIYVPLTAAGTNATQMTGVISPTAATGASNNTVDSKVKGEAVPLAAIATSNGTGTAYFEVTTDAKGTINTYTIPVYLLNTGGTLTGPASAITATVTFAPIGSASNVPNFINGTSTATVNGSTFVACSTTLLFPYLTNVSGFESGIALTNTSLDNLAAKGASSAQTQSGTCTLYFYGNATASSNPAAFTTGTITAGTTSAFTLTSAAGAGFSGYVLAECNFQFAHGFTYIVSSSTFATNGVAMGYVAFPLPTVRGPLAAGVPESLGN